MKYLFFLTSLTGSLSAYSASQKDCTSLLNHLIASSYYEGQANGIAETQGVAAQVFYRYGYIQQGNLLQAAQLDNQRIERQNQAQRKLQASQMLTECLSQISVQE